MPSVDATVRDLDPQPLAQIPAKAFLEWKTALIKQLQAIEAGRSAHHPVGRRVQNMIAFIERECAAVAQMKGSTAVIQAGKFHWFLVRLEQRQEGTKRLLADDDPFVQQVDPLLRRRIKKGWDLLANVESKYWQLVHKLQRQSRTKSAE